MSLILPMQGLLARGSGGGGGLPPNTYPNCTEWYDADGSAIYKGSTTSDGLAVNDGDLAARVDSNNAIARSFVGAGSLQTNFFGTNRAVDITTGGQGGFVRPAGTAVPSVSLTLDNLVNNNNAVVIFSGQIDFAGANSGTVYTNSPIFGELNGYFGIYCYQSGGTITVQAYNYDSTNGERVVTTTTPTSTPVVITLKHTGNVLRIRKNGVEIASIAALNTGLLTGSLTIGNSFGLIVSQLITYDAARTDAEILEVERWCGAKLGISI